MPYTINPTMSPLEAVYVTRFLIMQKEINESSLITPTERAEMRATIEKLADAGFQLTRRQRGAVMTALIDQKLHPEKPQQTAEELAARATQDAAEQTNIQYQSRSVGWTFLTEIQRDARRISTGLHNEGQRCSSFSEPLPGATGH